MSLCLPDLSHEAYFVTDMETHDPYLKTLGTNAIHRARGGKLLGFSVYTPGGFNEYFIYEGPDSPQARWLADQLARAKKVVGANLKYDLLWLLGEKIWTRHLAKRRYGDILINAALLDENATDLHNLDSQAYMYGLLPKKHDELLAAGACLGLKTLQQCKENMHLIQEAFPEVVASYGKHDSLVTGQVWELQQPLLDAEGLTEARPDRPEAMPVVELEERFLPLLVLMEANGIRVDVQHAQNLQEKLLIGIEEQKKIIKWEAGKDINFNTSNALKEYIEANYPNAARGGKKNSIKCGDKDLAQYAKNNPVLAAVLQARKLSKMQGTFIKSYILDKHVNGRIYPNIYQICGQGEDGEEGGTGTGRQSYSKPNFQNMPIRNEEWGPLIREIIIADEGCELASLDFSQQEPRWAITWAVRWGIAGAREAAQEFINNPKADWHGQVAAMLGGPEWRNAGKVLVLARMYEQGETRCFENMKLAGIPEENIPGAISNFDAKMGFLRVASKCASNFASMNGYVRTWSGRKRRFDLWEPKLSYRQRQARKEAGEPNFKPLPREEALELYFHTMKLPIARSKTYPAFNAVVQGSSADQTKQVTIVAFYEDDLLPDLEVHDELVDGKIKSHDIVDIYERHMLDTIKLAVPNKVGIKIGRHWQK